MPQSNVAAIAVSPPLFPGVVYPTGVGPRSVVAADLNGDSHPDLVVANQGSNTVSVLLNNGNGVVHPGDANGDTIVNMGDVTKVERMILGLDPLTLGADANEDGVVNMGDVTKIELIILGLN